MSALAVEGVSVGSIVTDLEISGAWAVDPDSDREGPADLLVEDGILREVCWLEGTDAEGIFAEGVIVAPGFIDLHAHLREPGNEDAETVASGLAAAAHGGYTTVCAMANTTPPLDEPSVLARMLAAATASGSPVALLAHGAVTAGRGGEQLAALGELADAGVVGFSDDGAPVRSPTIFRNALLYAGMLGLPIVDHAEDPGLTEGAEANEGLVATVLGLAPWPVAGEVDAVARDLAVLVDVLRDEPRARLHVTHVSTSRALTLIREAKARGLPVTCDVTPHHLALSDEWVAGARRWAWEALDGSSPTRKGASSAALSQARNPWSDGAIVAPPYEPACRVNPPLRSPEDALACLRALADGTADALATDHAPHTRVDKEVEFGLAANGIGGLETALGVLLAAVDGGHISLVRAIAALTAGPAAVLGPRLGRRVGLVEGAPADLVVVDRGDHWIVSRESLTSRGKNTPLLGRELPGRVLATVAGGRLAYAAEV